MKPSNFVDGTQHFGKTYWPATYTFTVEDVGRQACVWRNCDKTILKLVTAVRYLKML